jgi:gas vesicle protein
MVHENYDNPEAEPQNRDRHGRAVFTGVVLGGVAGAITALLLAPQSGKDTRNRIQNRVADARLRTTEKVEATLGQIRSRAGEIKAEVGNQANKLKTQGQDVLIEQLERVSSAAEARKKDIQSSRS